MHRASMLTLLVTAAATVAALAPASASAAQTVIGASRVGHFAAIPGINKFSAGGFGRPRTAAPIGISLRSGVSIGNLGQTGPVGRVSAPTNGPATNPPCIGACGLHVSPPIVWTDPPARNSLQPLVPCASSPVGCGSNPPARVVVAGPIVAPGQLGRNPPPPSPPPSPSNPLAWPAF